MNDVQHSSYFVHRKISGADYTDYRIPEYVLRRLPSDRNAEILDFGCGFGQFVRELSAIGYKSATGYDIEPAAIIHCSQEGIRVMDGSKTDIFSSQRRYQFIHCSHVLEHVPKASVIELLSNIRKLLTEDGTLMISVPNAQSHTAGYWAFEDFTHETLYTSGSLYYVLSKAGYSDIALVDADCTEGLPVMKRTVKKCLLFLYALNYRFWNRVTSSATHQASPDVFSYEIKMTAKRAECVPPCT